MRELLISVITATWVLFFSINTEAFSVDLNQETKHVLFQMEKSWLSSGDFCLWHGRGFKEII